MFDPNMVLLRVFEESKFKRKTLSIQIIKNGIILLLKILVDLDWHESK